jgi:hypothetical protein
MRPHDGLLGPLNVLYLVHALPPAECNGAPLDAYDHAKSAGARGWKTAVVNADPSVTEWRHVRESRVPGEWFTRFAVPVTRPEAEPTDAPGSKSAATKFFRTLLVRIEPDLVHVFDEVDLPRDWPELVAEAGIPVVRSLGSGGDQVEQMDARYREVVLAHPHVMQGRDWRRLRSRDG